MNRYAIIDGETILNVVISEPDFAASNGWPSLPENAGIGWSYINGEFIDNRPQPQIEVNPETLNKPS